MASAKARSSSLDTKFLHRIVDAGFGLNIGDKNSVVVVSNSADTASGITPQPVARIPMPKTLPIRYYPNQNKCTGPMPPKNPPRVKINNVEQKLDTMEEYRDFLYDRYNEHLQAIDDTRKEKIDARLEKHADLMAQRKEVAPTWNKIPENQPSFHTSMDGDQSENNKYDNNKEDNDE